MNGATIREPRDDWTGTDWEFWVENARRVAELSVQNRSIMDYAKHTARYAYCVRRYEAWLSKGDKHNEANRA